MRETLCSLFADYSELADLIPPPSGSDKDERREEMPYSDESLIGDRVNDSSDANHLLNYTIYFSVDREAGKVVAPYPFQKLRDPRYNFFRPFQNAMDYNLAHFFCSACLQRTQVDEFFRKGFLSARSDACHAIYSYHSAYTLYKKIYEMVIDPQWKNGFVDFKVAKNTEFWYRDIMLVQKYLLRRKSFDSHMVWAPILHFDNQGERVYTEMNSGTWWWDTQVLPPQNRQDLPP